jgi:hypothetical protein
MDLPAIPSGETGGRGFEERQPPANSGEFAGGSSGRGRGVVWHLQGHPERRPLGESIKTGEECTVHSGGTTSGSDTGGLIESGKLGGAGKIATVTAGEAPEGGGFGGGGPGGGR